MEKYFNKDEAYYDRRRPEMMAFLPRKEKHYLEVGCGNGNFGAMVKNDNPSAQYWGVEISEEAAKDAQTNIDKVIIGNFEADSLNLPECYFDCIVFNDVLEHFINPWEVLRRVRPLLTDHGCIVASIPSIRFFYALKDLVIYKQWNYVREGVQDITHLRFFTASGIRRLFESSGYEITCLEGINQIELPWKFRIFNACVLGAFNDTRYLQFACVARSRTIR